MASLRNPEGFAQCKLLWTLTGDNETMAVVFGVQNDLDQSADDIAGEVRSFWQARIVAGTLSSAWTFRGVEAQLGTADGEGGDTALQSVAVVGTASNAAMPQNVSMLVHKRSVLPGRQNRGRMYLPGGYLQENAVSPAGGVDAALITSFGGILNLFRSDLETAGLQMAILHSMSLGPISPTPVTNLVIDPVIGTQRTRLRR